MLQESDVTATNHEEKRRKGGEERDGERETGRRRAMPAVLLVKPKLGMINDRERGTALLQTTNFSQGTPKNIRKNI